MIYVFLLSFCIFLIIDYIYIYTFFDSKFFMSSAGSKLKYVLNKKNNIKVKQEERKKLMSKENIVRVLNLIVFLVILIVLNVLFFRKILFSNFIILDLKYKKIELVSAFDKYWFYFVRLYYIAYVIFLFILFNAIYKKYLIFKDFKMAEKNNDILNNSKKIYLGETDGKEAVYMDKEELYKNMLITGSIGSGKTSGAINVFCKYMLENYISGLIVDIKGNYVETINSNIKDKSKYRILEISDDNFTSYNPLACNVKSIELANRLRKVIELISPSNSTDSYWLDKVENVLFNIIVLIKYTNTNLELNEIHKIITDEEYLMSKLDVLKESIIEKIADEKAAHEINSVIMFFSKEYFNLDKRVSSIIRSEITRLTIPFVTEYDTCKRFAKENPDSIKIDFTMQKPTLIILSINMSKNFLLAKMLATFIKLEFQSLVLQNITNPIETFCICDEYQEFANSQDAHFLSLSREAKCMNIYSMQSYSSLINILKNEHTAKVIIQNLVNKIWFRNDDNYTIEEVIKQIGQEKKLFKTSSLSEGAQESNKNILNGLKNKKSNVSETISYAENNDYIYGSKVISQELETLEALVLISNNGKMQEVRKVKFKGRYINE